MSRDLKSRATEALAGREEDEALESSRVASVFGRHKGRMTSSYNSIPGTIKTENIKSIMTGNNGELK